DDAAGLDLRDRLGRDEDAPPRDRGERTRDRRIGIRAEAHDQVVDAAEPQAVRIDQPAAGDQREVEHLRRRTHGPRVVRAEGRRPPRVRQPWIETTSGMIRIATMFAILIIGLIAGPAVSLYGSPTVSPVTAAAWASEPLPP